MKEIKIKLSLKQEKAIKKRIHIPDDEIDDQLMMFIVIKEFLLLRSKEKSNG